MARAITANELALLRSDSQHAQLYLAVHTPAVVFKARVNQAFAEDDSHNKVVQVTYDGVTAGAYTDIVVGQTVYVGTSEGAYDKGMCRIRKTPTDAILYIGESSEVDFADNDYLTVVNEYGIWARHIRVDGTTFYMDYDVAYSAQHANKNPIPILGPDTALFILGDSSKELITNGTFADGTTTGWTAGGGALLSVMTLLTAKWLLINQNGAGDTADHCSQYFYANHRERYTLSVDVLAASHSYEIAVDVDGTETVLINSGTGTQTAEFTALGGYPQLILRATGDAAATLQVDNISIKAAEKVALNPDATDSWCPGTTISAYSWSAPGASGSADMTTASPTILYDAAGTYTIACTVTAASGSQTATGYRNVFVYTAASMPTKQFEITSASGDAQSGGWNFQVVLHDEALRSEIRDRAKVILFALDYYSNRHESIGPIAGGYKNVICQGWIQGETIQDSVKEDSVTFTVAGPHAWVSKIQGFPAGLEDTDFAGNGGGAPNRWTEMQDLTVDKALWHFIYWRTTAWMCMDVRQTGDTRQLAVIPSTQGSLWAQIVQILDITILARPLCDRYGRLYCQIEPQMVAVADRSTFPVVMAVTTADIADPLQIQRAPVTATALIELTGTAWSNGKVTPLGGRSPGDVYARFGDVSAEFSSLALSSQAQAITLAGLAAAWKNNEYPSIPLSFISNNRMIDIAPYQVLTLTVAAGDTERGISFTDKRLIPRSVSYAFGPGGAVRCEADCEAETDQWPAVKMTFPGSDDGPPPGTGGTDPEDPPAPPAESDPGTDTDVAAAIDNEVRTTANFDVASPSWSDKTGAIDAAIVDFSVLDEDRAWAITEYDAWYTDDMSEASPTWTRVFDGSSDWDSDLGGAPYLLRVIARPDVVSILAYSETAGGATGYLIRTKNSGGTWAFHAIEEIPDSIDDYSIKEYYKTVSDGFNWDTILRTGSEGDTTNPWAIVIDVHETVAGVSPKFKIAIGGWDSGSGSESGDEVCSFPFGTPYAYSDDYLIFRNSLLSVANRAAVTTALSAIFTSYATDDGEFPNDAARVTMGFKAELVGLSPRFVRYWMVWRKQNINQPKAMAVGSDSAVVYVGTDSKILVTRDGGVTWESYVEDHGAYDVHIPAYANSQDTDLLYWSTGGNLYWAEGTPGELADYGASLLSESPAQNTPVRIASDPDTGYPVFALAYLSTTGFNLYMVDKGSSVSQSLLVTGIESARSLRLYKSDHRRIIYMDSADIWYTEDDGDTWSQKKGDWSTYGGPVMAHSYGT